MQWRISFDLWPSQWEASEKRSDLKRSKIFQICEDKEDETACHLIVSYNDYNGLEFEWTDNETNDDDDTTVKRFSINNFEDSAFPCIGWDERLVHVNRAGVSGEWKDTHKCNKNINLPKTGKWTNIEISQILTKEKKYMLSAKIGRKLSFSIEKKYPAVMASVELYATWDPPAVEGKIKNLHVESE